MRLQKAIIIAIIGLSISFFSRLTATFFPGFFNNFFVALINAVILLLSILAVLYFCYIFLQDFITRESANLQKAALLLITSVVVVALLHLKVLLGMILPYNYYFFHEYHLYEPVAAWIAALLSFVFFIVFYREYNRSAKLKKAIMLAAGGSAAGLVVRTLTTLRSTFYPDIRDMNMYHNVVMIIGFILIIFSFVTFIYFLMTFYSQQKKAY